MSAAAATADDAGVWEDRARRARHEIADLAASGLGVVDLHRAAIDVVEREVGTDLVCWATLDPENHVLSAMTPGRERVPATYEPLLGHAEYVDEDEPSSFAGLARRGHVVSRSSDRPEEQRGRSTRLNEVWRPLGLDRELRVLFVVDGVCWGGAGMVRAGTDFSDREVDFLAALGPTVAGATRLAVRAEAGAGAAAGPPAVVVVGPAGEIRSATAAARGWQERLDEIAPGRFAVMMRVMAAGGSASRDGVFRARVRDARGRWAVMDANPLLGGDDGLVAVSLQSASGDRLTGLLMAAHGLTPREREVCHEVVAGLATSEIAARMAISALTVQDHLKSVFAKVDVRSRGELVARLRPEPADPGRG